MSNSTIKIAITAEVAGSIKAISSIIGTTVDIKIPGSEIIISAPITEIITDDGTIIDRESIIINGRIDSGINAIGGSDTREGNAPRGSLIRGNIA